MVDECLELFPVAESVGYIMSTRSPDPFGNTIGLTSFSSGSVGAYRAHVGDGALEEIGAAPWVSNPAGR
jgi:hypothetical protein